MRSTNVIAPFAQHGARNAFGNRQVRWAPCTRLHATHELHPNRASIDEMRRRLLCGVGESRFSPQEIGCATVLNADAA